MFIAARSLATDCITLLVAALEGDSQSGSGVTFTLSDTAGGSWTEAAHADHVSDGGVDGVAVIATRKVTTGGALTVTATASSGMSVALTVYDVTGQAATPVGATAKLSSTTQDAGASLTTTTAGSLVFVAADDWAATGAASSGDLSAQAFHMPGWISGLSGYKTAGASGPQTMNVVAGTAGWAPAWQIASVEIVPGTATGTGTQSVDTVCVATGSGSPGTPLTATGTVTTVAGHENANAPTDKALHFAGAGMVASTGPAPVVTAQPDQNTNSTIMAWVHVPADSGTVNDTGTGPPALVGGTKTFYSVDAGNTSAVTAGLSADPGTVTGYPGAARFTMTLTGVSAGTTVTAMDLTDDVRPGWWYEVAAQVDARDRTVELDVTAHDPSFFMINQPVVKQVVWPAGFLPVAPTGSLRLGSAMPTAGAPTTPVNPWVGDVDEVLAFRGVMPSADAIMASADLTAWAATNVPPWPARNSPCG